jgi:hypothetical protein
VAIPSLILHAFLSRKARGFIDAMEKAAVALVNQLGKTPMAEAPAVDPAAMPPAPPAPAAYSPGPAPPPPESAAGAPRSLEAAVAGLHGTLRAGDPGAVEAAIEQFNRSAQQLTHAVRAAAAGGIPHAPFDDGKGPGAVGPEGRGQ